MDGVKLSTPSDLIRTTIRRTLLSVVAAHGFKPLDRWVEVRHRYCPGELTNMYTVVIDNAAARFLLSGILRHITNTTTNGLLGVWLLSESQARRICAGGSFGNKKS